MLNRQGVGVGLCAADVILIYIVTIFELCDRIYDDIILWPVVLMTWLEGLDYEWLIYMNGFVISW